MAKTPAPLTQAQLLEQYQTWDWVAPPSDELVVKRLHDAYINRHWDIVDYHHNRGHNINIALQVGFDKKTVQLAEAARVSMEYDSSSDDKKIRLAKNLPVTIIPILDDDGERVKWLLARGVDVDEEAKDWNKDKGKQNTGVMYALAFGKNRAARALLAGGANVERKAFWGDVTPQTAAERAGNLLGAAMVTFTKNLLRKTGKPPTENELTSPEIVGAAFQLAALQPPAPKGWGARLVDSFKRAMFERVPLPPGVKEGAKLAAANTNRGAVM